MKKILLLLAVFAFNSNINSQTLSVLSLVEKDIKLKHDPVQEYNIGGKKWLFSISVSAVEGGVFFVDMADYMGITGEGKHGYVTCWLYYYLGIGIKVGCGTIQVPIKNDDLKTYMATGGITTPGYSWINWNISADENGDIKEFEYLTTSNLTQFNIELLGNSFKVLTFEIKKEVLDDFLNRLLVPGYSIASFAYNAFSNKISNNNEYFGNILTREVRRATVTDEFSEIQMDIRYSNLKVNNWGNIEVDVTPIISDDYRVQVWEDSWLGFPTKIPEWEWANTTWNNSPVSGPKYITANTKSTFSFPVKPEDTMGDFYFWLYKGDGLITPPVVIQTFGPIYTLDVVSDSVGPYVASTNYLPDIKEIDILFNEDISSYTITGGTVILRNSIGEVVSYNIEVTGKLLRLKLLENLIGENILTIKSYVQDLNGNRLDQNKDNQPGPDYTYNITGPGFTHDYAVKSISLPPTNPIVGEVLKVTAVIKNEGTVTESANQKIYLYDNGVKVDPYYYSPSIVKGGEATQTLNWTAVAGVHELKVEIDLAGDENQSNDTKSTTLFVGTAGNLLVDGEQNPIKDVTLNPGNTGLYTFQLQNTGSADIIANVTKSGTNSNWITLTDGSPVTVIKNGSREYKYKVVAPTGTPPGNYTASMLFKYNVGEASVTFNIKVIDFVPGLYTDQIQAGSFTIDGSRESATTLTHMFNNSNAFSLDNNNSTAFPEKIDHKIDFTNSIGSYNNLNRAEWEINSLDEKTGSARLYLQILEGAGSKYYTADQSNLKLNILEWFAKGSNTIELSLSYMTSGKADVEWFINNSRQTLEYSKASWAKDYLVSSNDINRWNDGWDYCKIYFDVISVSKAGDIILFNNGKNVASNNIYSSDNGKTKAFNLTSSEIKTSNYFNIKGDPTDDTKVTIGNIRIEVHYFSGDPNLECSKAITLNEVNVNQEVNINLKFKNIGSNIADEPRFDDLPLPAGLTLVSGITGGDPGDIDPNDSTLVSYTIKPTIPGTYTFGATMVTYKNPSGNSFQSMFNSVKLNVYGGNLLLTGELNKNTYETGEPITVLASVKESVNNTNVNDAIVSCTFRNISNNTVISSNNYLVYNSSLGKYTGTFTETLQSGSYEVSINAQKNNYKEANLIPPLNFIINPIPSLIVTPMSQTVGYLNGTVNYSVSSNIDWSVTESEDWLTATKKDNTTIQVVYTANYNSAFRSGTIVVKSKLPDRLITLSQDYCKLTLSESYINLSDAAGSKTFSITSNSTWTITDDAAWITVTPGSGNDSALISINFTANTGSTSRTGKILISGCNTTKTITVTQDPSCTFSIFPPNLNFPCEGGSLNVSVTSNSTWTVADDATWITVSPASGSNNGTLAVSVTANTGTAKRTGSVTITGCNTFKIMTVIQDPCCTLSVTPTSLTFTSAAGNQNVSITSNSTWAITYDATWITISPEAGSNNGTLAVTVTANTGSTNRSATVTVAGTGVTSKTITVIQAGTTLPWTCGNSITINHEAGTVAPVDKTVTYGSASNIPGEPAKCWITQNLGSDHQATAVNDATEASAGWYWQFNRKQGYKHDGTSRTPNNTWINSISEDNDWQAANDPCALAFGSGWRIPTSSEWTNIDASGGWSNWSGTWNSALKLHAAGNLYYVNGSLANRSIYGLFWSSSQYNSGGGHYLGFGSTVSDMGHSNNNKADGLSLRCLKDNVCNAPSAPILGTITHPTCTVATGSVILNGLPVSETWTINPGTITGTGTSKTITGLASGTYNFTVTNASLCISPTSANVVISPQPATPQQPTISHEEGNILHSDTPNGNQWYNNLTGKIDGAELQDYIVTTSGDYYSIVTIDGCSSDTSNLINVVIPNVGLELTKSNKTIKIYPNPVTNALTIEIKGNTKSTEFKVLNSLGQVIYEDNIVEKAVVHTSNFNPGVYLIKFESGNAFKFIKIMQ